MIAYFTASIGGKKQHLLNYLHIINVLKSKKILVISNHIIKSTESQITLEKKKERLKFHAQLEKWINSCQFMVAETSFPSISVGYEISLAIHIGKPVLILYSEGNPPSLFPDHYNGSFVCEKYTLRTLNSTIDNFITYAQGLNDVKFTFWITREIASYLDRVSEKEKTPKSVHLRKLIEEDMKVRK